jgi:hypothetical protein
VAISLHPRALVEIGKPGFAAVDLDAGVAADGESAAEQPEQADRHVHRLALSVHPGERALDHPGALRARR